MSTTRAATYARVSTTEQASEGYSIETQLDKCMKYADIADWEVVDSYTDGGISGSLALGERPEGARLLRDAKAGLLDVVIFVKIDRFARTVRKALEDFETLEDCGVEVVFVDERIDTTTPQGRMFRTLLLTFAEFEREQIRDRNMAGRYAKAAAGEGWASGTPPYGYEIGEDGHLVENEEESAAIKFMFRQRAQGRSLRAVAKAANDRGYAPRERKDSKTGQPIPQSFTSGSVSQYIANENYRGAPVTRKIGPADGAPKEVFEFPVPAIVSDELWHKANTVNMSTKTGVHTLRASQRPYGLRGRIWHRHGDETEATMFGHARNTSRGMTRYYRCTASRRDRTNSNSPLVCDGFGFVSGHELTSIQADFVEAVTALWILDQIADPKALEQLIAKADSEISGVDIHTVNEGDLRIAIAKVRAKQDRWVEQYAEGFIDKPTRDNRIGSLQDERDALERELARAQAHQTRVSGLTLDLQTLLGMDITEGEDDDPEDDYARGSAEWWSEIRSAASRTLSKVDQYGGSAHLPDWIIREVANLANLLDLHVILQRSDDPRRPSVRISVSPSAITDIGSVDSTAYAVRGRNKHTETLEFRVASLGHRVETWGYNARTGSFL